jgi:hypothetical protein
MYPFGTVFRPSFDLCGASQVFKALLIEYHSVDFLVASTVLFLPQKEI